MRRQLLIDARKAAGKTQEQVAELVGVDRTTLGKWERHESTPHPYQRIRYADALGLGLADLDRMLHSVASQSEETPEWLSTYLAMEQSATKFCVHEPRAVHGLLQTPSYTDQLVRRVGINGVSDNFRQRMVEQRLYRQKRVRNGDLELDLIQTESVLHLLVGDASVMAEQLRTMEELAELPNVRLRITTYDAGQYEALRLGNFVIMEHPWDKPRIYVEGRDGMSVNTESYNVGHFITDADMVAHFGDVFDHACRIALSPKASQDYMRQLAEAWNQRRIRDGERVGTER